MYILFPLQGSAHVCLMYHYYYIRFWVVSYKIEPTCMTPFLNVYAVFYYSAFCSKSRGPSSSWLSLVCTQLLKRCFIWYKVIEQCLNLHVI